MLDYPVPRGTAYEPRRDTIGRRGHHRGTGAAIVALRLSCVDLVGQVLDCSRTPYQGLCLCSERQVLGAQTLETVSGRDELNGAGPPAGGYGSER